MQTAAPEIAPPAGSIVTVARRLELQTVLLTLLALTVGFVTVYPIAQIALQSFQASIPGQTPVWSLDGWHAVFTERGLQSAAWNTVTLTVVRQGISVVIGVFIAWLLARTNLPGARIFEFLFWLAFFFPSLTVTLSWILLLDPQFGLINQWLRSIGFGEGNSGPMTIYSFWGIVWVQLMATTIAVKVMLLTPAFRNMNASFEEASYISGSSTLDTFRRIFIPLMMPVILAVQLLAILRSLEAFEIEQILGGRINLRVFSTWIYSVLNQQPPRYDAVSALAVVTIVVALGLILLQRTMLANRSYTTVTGKFGGQLIPLGRSRWPLCVGIAVLLVLIIGVPVVFAIMGTFMKLFGFFMADGWSLQHWNTALNDRTLGRALGNTMTLALSTALVSVFLHSLLAYVLVRTKFFGRSALDVVTWLPFAVPGVVLSLGLVTMLLQPAFRPIYGTMAALGVALVIAGMPFSVQIVKSSLMQIGTELEEASWVTGANGFRTYLRVVLPLLSPTLVVTAIITFLSATRNIAQVALLSTPGTQPLSVLQLNYLVEGKYEIASVLSVILLCISLVLAVLARVFGYRGVTG
ncbi:MAG: ABC transporter permease [Chloroflexota bacterium]